MAVGGVEERSEGRRDLEDEFGHCGNLNWVMLGKDVEFP